MDPRILCTVFQSQYKTPRNLSENSRFPGQDLNVGVFPLQGRGANNSITTSGISFSNFSTTIAEMKIITDSGKQTILSPFLHHKFFMHCHRIELRLPQ